MGYLILGVVVLALIFWMLIDCVQELGTRVSRLEREKILLEGRINALEYKMLEYKEDN